MDRLPPPPLHLVQGRAGVVVPAAVVPEDIPVGPGHPGELRDRVGQGPESLLAPPEVLDGQTQLGGPLADPVLQLHLGEPELILDLPTLAVDPLEDVGVPDDAPGEDGDGRDHPDRRAEPFVEDLGPVGQDRQAVQGEREEDGHREEPPGHQAARGVAGDRRHQAPTRPGHEHAEGHREHPQRRVQGHLVVGGRADEQPDPVGVADQGRAGDQPRDQGQDVGHPVAPVGGQQHHRGPDQEEVEGRRRVHTPRVERPHRSGRLAGQELVDPQVEPREILEERQGPDRRGRGRQPERRPVEPPIVPDRPEGTAGHQEAEGGVGLHRDQAGNQRFQGLDVQRPSDQDHRADRDRDRRAEPGQHAVSGPVIVEGAVLVHRGISVRAFCQPGRARIAPELALGHHQPSL